jgi:monoamine oxidase
MQHSRRNFCKLALGAAAFNALRPANLLGATAGLRVVVIGAGASGLAAAKALKDQFNVTVIEGRDRIGGRIWTRRDVIPGYGLEFGAQFLHGLKDKKGNRSPTDVIAEQQGWTKKLFSTDTTRFRYRGRLNDSDTTIATLLFADWKRWATEEKAPTVDKNYTVQQSFEDYSSENLLSAELQELLRDTLRIVEIASADDIGVLGLKYIDDGKHFDVGGDNILVGGYDQFINYLAAGLDIRLNKKVTTIDLTGNQGAPAVVTTDGGAFPCDFVLVTVPLGVLKKTGASGIQFLPELPDWKQGAISRMGMGAINKVFLKFPGNVLPPDNWQFSSQADRPFGHASINLDPVYPSLGMSWGSGEFTREREKLDDAEIVAAVMADMRASYPEKNLPDPVAFGITRWNSDPFAFGTYSSPRPGSTSEDYDLLAAPVGLRLFFAGEATNRDYRSTVHGAYLSGLREADRILSAAEAVSGSARVSLARGGDNTVSVRWTGQAGNSYQPQGSNGLKNWEDIGQPIPGTNGVHQISETVKENRFYRVKVQ